MKILLLNQCFYPDVVSTAQQLTDLAVELRKRGHDVTVIASNRGYDNPDLKFPRREQWNGIEIIRISTLAVGKKSRWRRSINFASFLIACAWKLLLTRRVDVVVGLTSPPLISVLGAFFARLKGGRFVFWIMDLNPDEAIAAGWLKSDSLTARTLSALLVYSLKGADQTVVLDRFMNDRIMAKGIPAEKLCVIPPWSLNDNVAYTAKGRDAFRSNNELTDQFVVMYSGNHSPCHPLDTMLTAAQTLAADRRITFCFVGGGSEFQKVKTFASTNGLSNIRCLPYQPIEELAGSLSAADLHVVVMGDAFTGIVHPSKIYNIMTVGTPILYIGPRDSHIGDIIERLENKNSIGSFRHNDAEGVVEFIKNARALSRTSEVTAQPGEIAVRKGGLPPLFTDSALDLSKEFSRENLLPQMIAVLESSCGAQPEPLQEKSFSNKAIHEPTRTI